MYNELKLEYNTRIRNTKQFIGLQFSNTVHPNVVDSIQISVQGIETSIALTQLIKLNDRKKEPVTKVFHKRNHQYEFRGFLY